MNKKKRKLRAPIASLSDKQFLLNTPIAAHDETPRNRGHRHRSISSSTASSSILDRANLTYTPMTRKLFEKQIISKKTHRYEPNAILPSIASVAITNNNLKRKKKRTFSQMEEHTTPIIPGSVPRKKRRLSSNSKSLHKSHPKSKLSACVKKKVMKKVLNNEYNPSLSLSAADSKSPSMKLLIDYERTSPIPPPSISAQHKTNHHRRMVLDFDTPSQSPTPVSDATTNNYKKRKRRLSRSRDMHSNADIIMTNGGMGDERETVPKTTKNNMISRRRRKRHSLSSNAIKKITNDCNKKRTKTRKEISPFEAAIPMQNVKKTYKRRRRNGNAISQKKTQRAQGANKEKKRTQHTSSLHVSICPLLTKLMEDSARHPSQIASISYECFVDIYPNINVQKQSNILRKLDSFLCLLSRAEIMLNNDEQRRLNEIEAESMEYANDDSDLMSDSWDDIYSNNRNQKKKKKKENAKRVRFCCYDLSTVTTPEYGDMDSIKHLQSICRLLVQSGKIGLKLFHVKSEQSWTRKSIQMFIDSLRSHDCGCGVREYLLREFECAYNNVISYPYCQRVSDLLSSQIRFYLKTIWNASEFLGAHKENAINISIPKWYSQIGTYSVFDDDEAATEFIPYHAAEISINLESYYCLTHNKSNKTKDEKAIQEAMEVAGIAENPFVFFNEMKQVLSSIKHSIYGAANTTNEFEKYLQSKWKELKLCLENVQLTKSNKLYFYLPLLDFNRFLMKRQI